jgi:hypothetical protein
MYKKKGIEHVATTNGGKGEETHVFSCMLVPLLHRPLWKEAHKLEHWLPSKKENWGVGCV